MLLISYSMFWLFSVNKSSMYRKVLLKLLANCLSRFSFSFSNLYS